MSKAGAAVPARYDVPPTIADGATPPRRECRKIE
jgi:hypothetical protein